MSGRVFFKVGGSPGKVEKVDIPGSKSWHPGGVVFGFSGGWNIKKSGCPDGFFSKLGGTPEK